MITCQHCMLDWLAHPADSFILLKPHALLPSLFSLSHCHILTSNATLYLPPPTLTSVLFPRAFKCPPLCPKWLSQTSSMWHVLVWAREKKNAEGTVPQRTNLIDSFIWFQSHSSGEEIAHKDRSWNIASHKTLNGEWQVQLSVDSILDY